MKKLIIFSMVLMAAVSAFAQDSSNSGVRRRNAAENDASAASKVTGRMKSLYSPDDGSLSEGDVQWMRVIYRELDLQKDANAPLYFPEDVVDGQENLFRIIMRPLADNEIPAYEYLDGREIFTDQYRINVGEMLDRFYIYHTDAKGSSEKNPKFVIEEADVPTNEVLSYYIVEQWVYDNRNNRLKTSVQAICPVLHRDGDFGEPLKYPMFWVKIEDLRPHMAQQSIFISDDNNLPTCSYDDFFNLTLYEGDIYKTRNLKNKSMMQMFPDPDDMKRAQDSIQARLDSFENKLWVPNREEIIAAREAREALEAAQQGDSVETKATKAKSTKSARTSRNSSNKKTSKVKSPKQPKSSSSNSNASRSVRRKK